MSRPSRFLRRTPAEAATLGLSGLQWDLLDAIHRGRQPVDLYAEGDYTRSAQAAVCRALGALERRGLLIRSPLALTEIGAEAARQADQIRFDRDLYRRRCRDILRHLRG